MKLIDLLNKIANGEEVPEKIKLGDDIYYRKIDAKEGDVIDYLDGGDNSLFNFITDYKYCFIKSRLEWEIKDLEEGKKIPEKICTNRIINAKDILEFEMIQNKINAEYTYAINGIIDYLKSKGE